MKKVFTHENRLIVFNIKNLLEDQGINCLIKNEFSSGGVGDLSPFETWPEVWVSDDKKIDLAEQIIKQMQQGQSPEEEWVCKQCGESNGGNFHSCWNCNMPKD